MMNKKPAEQAMDSFNEMNHQWCVSKYKTTCTNQTSATIREALSLLARVQRGEVKVLAREPTENMIKTSEPLVWADDSFKAMWDAAPGIAEGDQS